MAGNRVHDKNYLKEKQISTKPALIPIIQTRSMKAKSFSKDKKGDKREKLSVKLSDKLERLNNIDILSPIEIADGEKALVSGSETESVCNDGVEISINGSDDEDEFPEVTEPGEILSSEDESCDNPQSQKSTQVASKVVKVNRQNTTASGGDGSGRQRGNNTVKSHQSQFDKFEHLHLDPDFRDFVKGIVVDQQNENDRRKDSGHSGHSDPKQPKQAVTTHKPLHRSGDKGTEIAEICNANESPVLHNRRHSLIKSPSDTTIYSPGL